MPLAKPDVVNTGRKPTMKWNEIWNWVLRLHPAKLALGGGIVAVLALSFTLAAVDGTKTDDVPAHIRAAALENTHRVFLDKDGRQAYGTVTNGLGGLLSADHVVRGMEGIVIGPDFSIEKRLEATDFAFLTGSDSTRDPDSIDALEGQLWLSGYPAGSLSPRIKAGKYHATDTVPPGVWILLDGDEPAIGGESGGGVFDDDGDLVAIVMGTSTMHFEGKRRQFARVIPLSAALAEAQGHDWTSPLSFAPGLGPPLPPAVQTPLLERGIE